MLIYGEKNQNGDCIWPGRQCILSGESWGKLRDDANVLALDRSVNHASVCILENANSNT